MVSVLPKIPVLPQEQGKDSSAEKEARQDRSAANIKTAVLPKEPRQNRSGVKGDKVRWQRFQRNQGKLAVPAMARL